MVSGVEDPGVRESRDTGAKDEESWVMARSGASGYESPKRDVSGYWSPEGSRSPGAPGEGFGGTKVTEEGSPGTEPWTRGLRRTGAPGVSV